MKRNIRLSSIIISMTALACLVCILAINLVFGFYLGPEMKNPEYPALEIKNSSTRENSLPNWVNAGKDGYKLVFAVNSPGPGKRYSAEENMTAEEASMMVAVLDPFKKEMYQVENNIYRDNLDDNKSRVSLTPGKRYGTIMAGNGVLVYEEDEEFLNYCVYYTFNRKVEPVLPFYGNANLAYTTEKGLFKKPVISIRPLAGGMSFGGGFMQGQPELGKTISLSAGKLIGWRGGQELLLSSSRLNRNFKYADMHDLWRVSADGSRSEKLCDNVYEPVLNENDDIVIFLRVEKANRYSLWKLLLNGAGHEEKIIEFDYTSHNNQMPAITMINRNRNMFFDICYTADSKDGKKSIMTVNPATGETKTLVKEQNIKGPIISSSKIDAGAGKYLLYFSEENKTTKAYVVDNNGKLQAEIYDMLRSAPVQPYRKMESE